MSLTDPGETHYYLLQYLFISNNTLNVSFSTLGQKAVSVTFSCVLRMKLFGEALHIFILV